MLFWAPGDLNNHHQLWPWLSTDSRAKEMSDQMGICHLHQYSPQCRTKKTSKGTTNQNETISQEQQVQEKHADSRQRVTYWSPPHTPQHHQHQHQHQYPLHPPPHTHRRGEACRYLPYARTRGEWQTFFLLRVESGEGKNSVQRDLVGGTHCSSSFSTHTPWHPTPNCPFPDCLSSLKPTEKPSGFATSLGLSLFSQEGSPCRRNIRSYKCMWLTPVMETSWRSFKNPNGVYNSVRASTVEPGGRWERVVLATYLFLAGVLVHPHGD